jgi:hypothetical protein
VPRRIVLDIDHTFDRVHGGQQLRLFNYGFQPIVVFDGEGRNRHRAAAAGPTAERHPVAIVAGPHALP